jgi:WD40 repeat protein
VVTLSGGAIRTWTIAGGRAILVARAFAPAGTPRLRVEPDRILAVGDTAAVAITLPRDAASRDAALAVLEPAAVAPLRSAPLQAILTGEDPFRRTTITVRRPQATEEWALDSLVLGATASPDGERVAVVFGTITRGGWQRRIVVFDAMSRDTLAAATLPGFAGDGVAASIAHSMDGRFLINRTEQGFEARDAGTLAPAFALFHAGARGIALQPAGALAATFGGGSTRVWDTTTGLEIARVEHDGPPAAEAALSTDGIWMLTAHDDGSLRLWAISTEALLAQACRSLGDRCTAGA